MTEIRLAGSKDAAAIATMLRCLANEIGDGERFCSDAAAIRQHGFGTAPLFQCVIAGRGPDALGLALYFPGFSTTMAVPGLYVQDLWVAEAARGTGLGKRLLVAAARHAYRTWGAGYLGLTVYEDNPKAQGFYHGLGFELHRSEHPSRLTGAGFAALIAPG